MKSIFVFINKDGFDLPLGTIYIDNIRGKESYSFEFDEQAIKNKYAKLLIDADIAPVSGRQYKADTSIPYHFMSDSTPDRWGRNLLLKANSGKRMSESDYLLLVNDVSRMGALRYKISKEGKFLSEGNEIPPYRFLRELEQAAYSFDLFSKEEEWKPLLDPGSSLGGARPKASIYGNKGELYLAKFSNKKDEMNLPQLEYFAYLLATKVGVSMMPSKLLNLDNRHSVFLTERFDRMGNKRIHYASFMTLLGANEEDSSSYSYIDVAETISKLGYSPSEDLKQMFLRIALGILIHNYDDHLRNHAMIHTDDGWRLSPAFDINISFDKSNPTLPPCEKGFGIDALISSSPFFGLSQKEGEDIVSRMRSIIKENMHSLGIKASLSESTIESIGRLLSEVFA